MNNNEISILQWNCQGLNNKKDELSDLIQRHNPLIIALQETMLGPSHEFKLPNYNCTKKSGHFNRRHHGGVAIYSHDTLPFQEVELNTPLQATAIRTLLHRTITICCIYNSRNHALTEELLQQLLRQLTPPVILLGDFNSYSRMWGSTTTDARGQIVESFLSHNNLNILNNGTPTRIGYQTETAIDLSICTSELEPDILWTVRPSPGGSDHCPILVTLLGRDQPEAVTVRRNYKRADWGSFQHSQAWNDIPEAIENINNQHIIDDFYRRINSAAETSIPSTTSTKFFPKPWWSAELKASFDRRERLYHRYRLNKSPQNERNWRKARAEHKYLTKRSKKESWEKLASSFNKNTPMGKVWEDIRKIKGRTPRKITILSENNQDFTTVQEIAGKLASTFSKISSTANYCAEFQNIKQVAEAEPINLQSDNNEHYNQPFTMEELKYALSKPKNSAPGPDNVTYNMINNLPDDAMQLLLKIFNKYFTEGYFPQQWSETVIVPIPKPNKDHSNPLNYRPISLTSSICKTIERMINDRLLDFLENIPHFGNIQAGGRKGRSTIDHLIRLETTIRKAFINNEHNISIFFDLEKAYDSTWRHGIIRDLQQLGLRGRLPKYIMSFLENRQFTVKINETHSPRHIQETGIPQGSVLSVTLFIIKIDNLYKLIPRDGRFLSSLFVDDLQISYSHADLEVIRDRLQTTLNTVSKWATENGFKFSVAKTNVMHFHRFPGLLLSPELTMNNNIIPYVDTVKFLGLIWDKKLSWLPHITKLKANCQKHLGLLKSLTSTEWGADQDTLLHIYRALIRSKLDYGQIVYASASDTTLNLLNCIPNEAIRIATGAFRSSPVSSLQVLVNERPLDLRRKLHTLKYYYKMKSLLKNPAYNQAIIANQRQLYMNKNQPFPFVLRAQSLIESLNLRRTGVKPGFSYSILNIKVPTWRINAPKVNLDLTSYKKEETPSVVYRQLHGELINELFEDSQHIYTDGSKSGVKVGAAAVWRQTVKFAALPGEASIYTAEIHALHLAKEIIKEQTDHTKFVIFSDSCSALQKLKQLQYSDVLIRKLQHDLYELEQRGIEIHLCWIPGHVNIQGNESADLEAKRAARSLPDGTTSIISVPYTDFHTVVQEKFKLLWNEMWAGSTDKLREIRSHVGPWRRPTSTRSEQVKLNRLRVGHSRITHGHLMDNADIIVPPLCELCQEATLTIKHILIDCVALTNARRRFFGLEQPTNLKQILGDKSFNPSLFNFLKNINVYDQL